MRASLFSLMWAIAAHLTWAQAADAPLPFAREPPECVATQNGRADCLARDRAGRFIWQYHDGRKWSQAQMVPGEFSGPAACVVRGPLGLNCFAIRRDGSLWHLTMNGGRWRQWRPLGGRLALGRPSCVAPARNQIVCHARSKAGTLAVKSWLGDSTWQEWRDAGGELGSDPSCVRLNHERVACTWRRPDGRLSGLLPAEAGPGAAILTLPVAFGDPSCVPLDGDRVSCIGTGAPGPAIEWRGRAVLGGAGMDGVRPGPRGLTGKPICRTRAGRTFCAYIAGSGVTALIEATAQGWSAPAATGVAGAVVAGPCLVFDSVRTACFGITGEGELRASFRETRGPGAETAVSAVPQLLEKPAAPPVPPPDPVAAVSKPAAAPAPVATVSVREPLGVWRVFEPRTGLHCQVTLFDAPAQPYRSLTRDADCAAMTSLQGVDRWSQNGDGIFFRDRRGRVYFRFLEAGPTALRARWRRNDFIMMARDLRAFAAEPKTAEPIAALAQAQASPGLAGVWRVRGPGRQSCEIRLSVDPSTGATRAAPQGCQGMLAKADGWSVRRGALVLERGGVPLARFVEGRGVAWVGRFEGGRRTLRMVKQ